eukprot:scaffold98545_cov19-Tisochrysis_lutea.AAC.1
MASIHLPAVLAGAAAWGEEWGMGARSLEEQNASTRRNYLPWTIFFETNCCYVGLPKVLDLLGAAVPG